MYLVYLELLAEEESFIAVRTLERAVTGVDHAMLAQRALVDKRPTTHVTRIRPLACTDIFYYLARKWSRSILTTQNPHWVTLLKKM